MSDETKLRMNAYYFSFDGTGAHSIDRVLSAVACAGKAFHSTEAWTEECSPYHPEMRGNSCREWIQNAAQDAATELADMKAQRDEAQIALGVAKAALEECDANFAAIRDDWSDPRSECRAGRHACELALEAIAKVTP